VKWLQNNLLGVLLLGASGVLLLVAGMLQVTWNRPVSFETAIVPDELAGADPPSVGSDLGPFGEYRVVEDRPLFSETRRPVIQLDEAEQEPVEAEPAVAEADEPEVSLTGIVITPEVKLVSLTPKGSSEALVFREGAPMRGEYNGWIVSQVWPRKALLESVGGARVELELAVYDQSIKPPPKQAPVRQPEPAEELEAAGEQSDPLSRAEEIRQRIAERREQLRQEAATGKREPVVSPYQAAIQKLINPDESDDDDDDDG
jgi:hypothetical protein